jgi:hypothetical protein
MMTNNRVERTILNHRVWEYAPTTRQIRFEQAIGTKKFVESLSWPYVQMWHIPNAVKHFSGLSFNALHAPCLGVTISKEPWHDEINTYLPDLPNNFIFILPCLGGAYKPEEFERAVNDYWLKSFTFTPSPAWAVSQVEKWKVSSDSLFSDVPLSNKLLKHWFETHDV